MRPAQMSDIGQSTASRGPNMSRPLLLLIITQLARTAVVTENPSLTYRLEKLFEKLESFTISPPESLSKKIAAKIERLNSINLDTVSEDVLTDEDEEVLSAMQEWGGMSDEELGSMAQELQRIRMDTDARSEKMMFSDYSDDGWNEDDLQYYAMDEDWDSDDDLIADSADSTTRPQLNAVTPSSIIRLDEGIFRNPTFIDPIAATNERPRILDDSALTASERSSLGRSAVSGMRAVLQAGRCLTPQPRWLSVRQLAPAADIVYMPPCVQLHRCAPDAGCCYNESEVCAPVEGRHVILPFYLHRANDNNHPARLLFYNHTRCACVPRDALARPLPRTDSHRKREGDREMQAEWMPTEEPRSETDDESTAPTQMRRCTCPTLFHASILENNTCACVCDWADLAKRRDCVSLSRGREHFGIRDRVCIANGDCTLPHCEYGPYARNNGRCPLRKIKRRFNRRSQERSNV